jgi:hypothetical protein
MDALERLTAAVPSSGTIYHYTSQEGLLGIIKSKSLWASSIRHLSDAAEFGYAVDLTREKLNARLKAERGPWNTFYGGALEELDTIGDMTLFVGSFSEEGDSLSQWRAYTPNGIGFSVGFEFEHLKKLARPQLFQVMKCVYKDSEHDEILEELIKIAGRKIAGDGFDEAAVADLIVGLFTYAPAIKHPSFSEEHEWRIVSAIARPLLPGSEPVKFRPGKSMLIPYREFKLVDENEKLFIPRVVVGPAPHMELSEASLLYLLVTAGLNVSWQISRSSVPYRSW